MWQTHWRIQDSFIFQVKTCWSIAQALVQDTKSWILTVSAWAYRAPRAQIILNTAPFWLGASVQPSQQTIQNSSHIQWLFSSTLSQPSRTCRARTSWARGIAFALFTPSWIFIPLIYLWHLSLWKLLGSAQLVAKCSRMNSKDNPQISFAN